MHDGNVPEPLIAYLHGFDEPVILKNLHPFLPRPNSASPLIPGGECVICLMAHLDYAFTALTANQVQVN